MGKQISALPGRLELPSQPPEGRALSVKLRELLTHVLYRGNVFCYNEQGMKKLVPALFSFILFIFLCIVFWANRGLYTSPFDASYWTDKYEHSQWRLANSSRTIGDDGLYLYEGYRLVQGDNPTLLSAEVPPLGKYLIGLSIRFFGNPYVYGFLITTASVVGVIVLAWTISRSSLVAVASGLLVALDPLIADQFARTMLDSLQLMFLMLTLGALVLGSPVMTGLLFGLFSASKFPVLSPVIGAVILFFVWKRKKSLADSLLFVAGAAAGYLIPYIPYFLQGHTFLAWLAVQKYVVSFYVHGGTLPNFGSELTTLLVGRARDIFSRVWVTVPEWSPVWPLATLGGILWVGTSLRKKKLVVFPAIGALIIFFLFYLVIPFWTRYLVVVLPILYIGTILWLRQTFPKLFFPVIVVLLLINLISTASILFPTPETTVKQFTYDWSHGFFQDVYERLSASSKTTDRNTFMRFGQQTYYDGQIESVTITIPYRAWNSWKSPQMVPVTVTYQTRALGSFERHTVLPVVNEMGQWRVAWQWSNLIGGLTPDTRLKTTVSPSKRGSIVSGGILLARDEVSYMVEVAPKLVVPAKEQNMLKFLSALFDDRIPGFAIHNRYVENTVLDVPVTIGVIMKQIPDSTIKELRTYPGITIIPAYGRFVNPETTQDVGTVTNTRFSECCSLLYNTTNYDGVTGLEQTYNARLKGYDGGSLVLERNDGSVVQTIIDVPKKDGQSVQL